jgi:hypothetical protein
MALSKADIDLLFGAIVPVMRAYISKEIETAKLDAVMRAPIDGAKIGLGNVATLREFFARELAPLIDRLAQVEARQLCKRVKVAKHDGAGRIVETLETFEQPAPDKLLALEKRIAELETRSDIQPADEARQPVKLRLAK